jgi:alpha-tubulin suppressor-like RCC1 family protein
VWCWGLLYEDEVVDGAVTTAADSLVPFEVEGLGTTTLQLAVGRSGHSCARVPGDKLRCFGANSFGELGLSEPDSVGVPTDVPDVEGVLQVALGEGFSCVVTQAGAAYCWGDNSSGQLGAPANVTERSTPGLVPTLDSGVRQLALGKHHGCALLDGGAVKCWGASFHQMLGADYADEPQLTPVVVPDLDGDVVKLAAGLYYNCALFAGGGVKCWGVADFVGIGTPTSEDTPPVSVLGLP